MSTSVITVGTQIPGYSNLHKEYTSGAALHDYDVIVFNPSFPYYASESFSSGSSALTEYASQQINNDIRHWNNEISSALDDGKTIFVLLASNENEMIRTGHKEYKGKTTIHSTSGVNNYSAIPGGLSPTNSKGTKVKPVDSRFKQLHEILADHIAYQAYIAGKGPGTQIFSTDSGSNTLGSIYKIKESKGHIVLVPFYNLGDLTTEKDDKVIWTKAALGIGSKLMAQLLEIDKSLRKVASQTPTPEWVKDKPTSEKSKAISSKIEKAKAAIKKKQTEIELAAKELSNENSFQALLYENGTTLEDAIEAAMKLIGYTMSKYRKNDLEIDHIIESPENDRLIGEAEGKDSSAIDISKFRQLETNINEDFEREEIDEPARGILFGNGYRLIEPSKRQTEFTEKCLKNAKRLNTPLIRTSDLYEIAVYLSDTDGTAFKQRCRKAIKNNDGSVVVLPPIPLKSSLSK
jgi:hypothetical protein